MQLRYLGFDQLEKARAYRFGVMSRPEDERQFVVTVDLALFHKHGVGIQEGPSLCALKLAADLLEPSQVTHELTTEDFQVFVKARTAEQERKLQARKAGPRRIRARVAQKQSPWHTLQGH